MTLLHQLLMGRAGWHWWQLVPNAGGDDVLHPMFQHIPACMSAAAFSGHTPRPDPAPYPLTSSPRCATPLPLLSLSCRKTLPAYSCLPCMAVLGLWGNPPSRAAAHCLH